MKIPEERPQIYLEQYDINVNQYLSYAEIQKIVNSTEELAKSKDQNNEMFDSWSNRNQNIDMILLVCATDIPLDILEKTSHATFVQCGLIEAVKANIKNYNQLEEAFKYTESWDKILIYGLQKIATLIQSKDFAKKIREALIDRPDE